MTSVSGVSGAGGAGGGDRSEVAAFVDRREEVAAVRRLFGKARLVTLTGPGGVGKTRLALRVAARMRRTFSDGVCLVDLTSVFDGAMLEYQVAEDLRIGNLKGVSVSKIVLEYLRDRKMLLVLDNCDHLLDACADFASTALRAAGELRMLCTGRELLGIMGEHLFPVPPLAVPPHGGVGRPSRTAYPALELFVERAAAVASGFRLTADNAATVVAICRRLDGLPLAIELVAARLPTVPLDQLARGLDNELGPLMFDEPAERTLLSTFEWSFALCSPAERMLWARLSVFHGSFELTAVEWVCSGDGLPTGEVWDALAGLVSKSVVVAEEQAGQIRFRLLDTVRTYGRMRLRAGTAVGTGEPDLRRRHRDFYLDLAERFDAEWFGPRQPQWSRRMHAESPNLRAALDYCLEDRERWGRGMRLAGSLHYFWFACGEVHEGLFWQQRILAIADPRPNEARWRILAGYSRLLLAQGRQREAQRWVRECLELAERLDEPWYRAVALQNMALGLMQDGDYEGARPLLEKAVDLASQLTTANPFTTDAMLTLGSVSLFQGDPARAADLFAQGRERCRAVGDQWSLSHFLIGSAIAAQELGDIEQAAVYLRESLQTGRALDDPLGIAGSLERLGWLACAEGDHRRAARLLGAADRLWQDTGTVLYGDEGWLRRHDECVRQVRRGLGDGAYRAEFRQGRSLASEAAIREALDEAGPGNLEGVGAADRPGELTGREWEVALMIAEGRSNREIAARLVVAQRTAESYVENIMTKLAFERRSQIASWVVANTPREPT